VVLNRRDKEQLVIKLHQEGKTIREIAQQIHMSFKDIGTIIRRIDGQEDETEPKELKNKSKDTQALYLFSIGKTPLEVTIELDLTTTVVHEIQEEFWALNQLHELNFVYDEIKTFLPSFLKLFHCLKNNKMLSEKHISDALRYVGNDLPKLTDRVQCLSNDVINLEDQKRNLLDKLILWNGQLYDLGRAIDIKNQQLKRMSK
jgi:transposase